MTQLVMTQTTQLAKMSQLHQTTQLPLMIQPAQKSQLTQMTRPAQMTHLLPNCTNSSNQLKRAN